MLVSPPGPIRFSRPMQHSAPSKPEAIHPADSCPQRTGQLQLACYEINFAVCNIAIRWERNTLPDRSLQKTLVDPIAQSVGIRRAWRQRWSIDVLQRQCLVVVDWVLARLYRFFYRVFHQFTDILIIEISPWESEGVLGPAPSNLFFPKSPICKTNSESDPLLTRTPYNKYNASHCKS